MRYHMPRIVLWMEDRSIRYFPTVDYQQLTMPPFSEYTMMHIDLLYGSDRFVNLVQWTCFFGCIIDVSLIAGRLGADRRGEILAAVSCASIPLAVMAASGPKNDLVLTFWLVVAVYFLLRWKDEQNWIGILAIGAGIALALFTKGTAYVYLPCLLACCWFIWPATARRRFLIYSPVVLLLVLGLNAPQYLRNYQLSGSPLGFSSQDGEADKEGRRGFTNRYISLRGTATNVARNLAIHLGTPIDRVNHWTENRIVGFIRAIGADPDDPNLTEEGWSGTRYKFFVPATGRQEVTGGNPIHFALILLAGVLLLMQGRKMSRILVLYAVGLLGSFVCFCAVIRWMPQNGRLHLPIFVLGSALAGVLLPRVFSSRVTAVVCWLLLAAAVPFALTNKARPLLSAPSLHERQLLQQYYSEASILGRPRAEMYFGDAHVGLAQPYIDAVNAVRATGCHDIFVDASLEHYEYPIFALLKAGADDNNVRYAGVTNRSQRYATQADVTSPCAVICPQCAKAPQKWAQYQNVGGRVSFFGNVAVFSAIGSSAVVPGSPGLAGAERR